MASKSASEPSSAPVVRHQGGDEEPQLEGIEGNAEDGEENNDVSVVTERALQQIEQLQALKALLCAERGALQRWLRCLAACVSHLTPSTAIVPSTAAELVKYALSLLKARDCRTGVALAALAVCQAAVRCSSRFRSLLTQEGLLDAVQSRWLHGREKKIVRACLALLVSLTQTGDGRQRVLRARMMDGLLSLAEQHGGGGGHDVVASKASVGLAARASGTAGADTRHLALAVLYNLCHGNLLKTTVTALYAALCRALEQARQRRSGHDVALCARACEVLRQLHPRECQAVPDHGAA